jgi:predicted polyphosphate/ATP-dependent NAD kinase
MRLFNFIAWTGIAILVAFATRPAHAEAVMQKVCHEDVKTKKEVCKTIKTHKKVEGTPVPEKAPVKKK